MHMLVNENKDDNVTYLFTIYLFYIIKSCYLFYDDHDIYNISYLFYDDYDIYNII
jgi:hypothetical protein